MPRPRRRLLDAPFFHIVHRAVRRATLFNRRSDYRAFLKVLRQGLERHPVHLVAYCIMSNHWHLVVEPTGTDGLSRFMQWVTATHAARWHRHHHTRGQGHVYQGRFHSTPLTGYSDVVRVCRYVERNALRAGLVRRAQDWPWCSLAERMRPEPEVALKPAHFLSSAAWVDYVNQPGHPELAADYDPDLGAIVRTGFDGRSGPATSGTKRAKTVENSSDPLDSAERPGGRAKGREQRGRVVRRADEHEANAHVERAEHLVLVDAAGALQPREHRRHRPAAAVK